MAEPRHEDQAAMLINRVRKNRARLKGWLNDEGVGCYRLYDRDIPEIPLAVDWYEGRLHVAVFNRRDGMEDGERARWAGALAAALGEALEVERDAVFVKNRSRAPGGTQYGRLAEESRLFVVREAGCALRVNLSDYVDTGLFLDHRGTRARVRAGSADKRVLNLFGYTGAFTVQAAAGGAARTVTIDMSATYLDWARDNLRLNGFDEQRHELVRADVLAELERGPLTRERFDIVVLDPPTISRSKGMRGELDVQRDHVWMLERALALTAPGGVVYFSTNFRRFRFEGDRLPAARIEELTPGSIPPDFRDRKIHRCWRLAK